MTSRLPSARPYEVLEESLAALIECLAFVVPMRVWMITRVNGNDWNVLVVRDTQGEVTAGTLFHWPDSYCARMVEGKGPCFAPDSQAIPAYAEAPINQKVTIGAYIGMPLQGKDGELLGSLCGVDMYRKEEFTIEQVSVVEGLARNISTIIAGKLSLEQLRQQEANLRYFAELDALTGLANRHSWDLAVADEESAFSELGQNAMVMMVDLDGLKQANDTYGHAVGDQYIISAARTLRAQLRESDIVARLGGDEFGVIVRNTTKEEAEKLHERVKAAFSAAGIEASMGYAMRLACRTLPAALADADARMYEEKARRKQRRQLRLVAA